jgi:hypothetical protein
MEVGGKLHALVPRTHCIVPQNLSEQDRKKKNPKLSTGSQTIAIQSPACHFTEYFTQNWLTSALRQS